MPHKLFQNERERETIRENVERSLPNFKDISLDDIARVLTPRIEHEGLPEPVLYGRSIYPGAASGEFHYSFPEAREAISQKRPVIMYIAGTPATLSKRDWNTALRSEGIMCRSIGTDHESIIFSNTGLPMIQVDSTINPHDGRLVFKNDKYHPQEGEQITIDASTGAVYNVPSEILPSIVESELQQKSMNTSEQTELEQFKEALRVAENTLDGRLAFWANADDFETLARAREYGADNIGLVRTENLVKGNRDVLNAYLGLIVSAFTSNTSRTQHFKQALIDAHVSSYAKFLDFQDGRMTQIRLMDLPLMDICDPQTMRYFRRTIGKEDFDESEMQYFNTLLQDDRIRTARGVQLATAYGFSTVYEAQLEAFTRLARNYDNISQRLRLNIPFVSSVDDIKVVRSLQDDVSGGESPYDIGMTVEIPVAAMNIEDFARNGIRHIVVGTNDLYNLVMGGQARSTVTSDEGLRTDSAISRLITATLEAFHDSVPKNEYRSIGIAGEMNPLKLHALRNATQHADYICIGRPIQFPLLKVAVAQDMLYGTEDRR